MSWLLKKHKTAKNKKWKLWTTISDADLTYWSTEEQIKQAIVFYRLRDFKLEQIKLYMTFPNEWHLKEDPYRYQPIDKEKNQAYYDWYFSITKDTDNYDKAIDEKMEELGIDMKQEVEYR